MLDELYEQFVKLKDIRKTETVADGKLIKVYAVGKIVRIDVHDSTITFKRGVIDETENEKTI